MKGQPAIMAELKGLTQELRLPGMGSQLETVLSQTGGRPEELLLELLVHERNNRRNNRVARHLHLAQLPSGKTFSSFERTRLPAKINRQLDSLLDGAFLKRAENVLVFGRPGSGKTHLVSALAHHLVENGRRVYFATCGLLVQNLIREKRDLSLERELKKLCRNDAIILDDIGYVQQDQAEMECLFALFAYANERTSILLTSNLPFSKWDQLFKNPMTAAATIDRLVHNSFILELNLPSYRLETAKRRSTKQES